MVELARVFASAGLLLMAASAAADGPEVSTPAIHALLLPGRTVVEGGLAVLQVTVTGLADDPEMPAMLTPQVVGEAVEAVRGRLFKRDRTLGPGGAWSFELPLLARLRGSSEVGVTLVTYDCRKSCRELTLHTSVAVDVRLP